MAPINNGKVDASLKPDGENGYLIQPIVDILTKIANRERKVAELTGEQVRQRADGRGRSRPRPTAC